MAELKMTIQNGSKLYEPRVLEGVTWETARKGVPGKLEFTVVKDGVLSFQEGNRVSFSVDGVNLFLGFVFTKKRNSDGTIKVTAYDQLRYLKNKDTYNYKKLTAGELVKQIAGDFRLKTGVIENTGYVIERRLEDNKTLFDIIQTALDLTLQNKKKLYVLYDDYGKLTLKDIESMSLQVFINKSTIQDFDYTSSIDGETYNRIKLAYNNEKAGKRDIYIAEDSKRMGDWGVLQYFETINEKTNGKAKADALLSLYNQKTRNLSVSGALGDIRVRGGSSVGVELDLGDINLKNYMLVESVKHTFKVNEHFMDMTLRGGGTIA
ncbi:phage late control protein Gpd [Ruminiclostridium hungatei]|uniref:Phage late control protein Gpd n=1 Tax=Ruminiclostridium hungatei TaxID=48256 RepID=A0A1V4SIV7_RUMHU|nr:hydrolase [Ruminiclostridium hungatei]OPX43832.1 phage late control protein Gpd [Ruminiclostridium hungatei]